MQATAKIKRLGLIALEFVLFIAYAGFRLQNAGAIRAPRAAFGDSAEYLWLASLSLQSPAFWLSDRPFLIPLFFKTLGGNLQTIFTVQLCFSIVCWTILALACAYVIGSYPLKILAFSVVLGFSLSQQIILWDALILSDSLGYSLWALFISCGLLLCRKWTASLAVLLITLAALLAFTRDANAYMLFSAAVVLLPLMLLRSHALRLLLVGTAFTAVMVVSWALSSAGAHARAPLLNVIDLRILPNPEYRSYFEGQGMPVSTGLLGYSGQANQWADLAGTRDPGLVEFRTWFTEHGTAVFARFLWHYKADTLQRPLADLAAMLAPDLSYYSATRFKPILEKTRFAEVLYPMRFGIVVFAAANMLAAFMGALALQHRKTMWLVPTLMIVLAYPHIVFVWNTDPNDMPRHALPLNVQWRLGLWLLVLLGAEQLIKRGRPGFQKWSGAIWRGWRSRASGSTAEHHAPKN